MQKGSAIFFAVIAVTVVLSIAFGLNILVFHEIESLRGAEYSFISFYAAEAGIEHILFVDTGNTAGANPCGGDVDCLNANNPGEVPLVNDATYVITVQQKGGPCQADVFCAQAVGTFQGVVRKIEIER
jgi:hypothetical protein